MSTSIRNSLANLDRAIDILDKAMVKKEYEHKAQEEELFAARAALNDNADSNSSANVEEFSAKLDNAIDKVERLLREG